MIAKFRRRLQALELKSPSSSAKMLERILKGEIPPRDRDRLFG